MQEYDTTPAQVPALSKTWEATVTYRCYGENWGSSTHIVTISNYDGYTAEIDGKPATVHDAARILESAKSDNGLKLIRTIRPMSPSMKACLGLVSA